MFHVLNCIVLCSGSSTFLSGFYWLGDVHHSSHDIELVRRDLVSRSRDALLMRLSGMTGGMGQLSMSWQIGVIHIAVNAFR